ncbi:hypothetical protein Btaycd_013730, partial [Bartonella taylorii]
SKEECDLALFLVIFLNLVKSNLAHP